MAEIPERVVIGSRGSALARWQSEHVRELLLAAWPGLEVSIEIFHTQGDRVLDTPLPLIGGKGIFTAELETALHEGEIDIAVHSLKDLPTETPPALAIGATPKRARVDDALISRSGQPLASLPPGATVGTSSRRRGSQLLRLRPDLKTTDIRGNVDTRLRKVHDADGIYDAIILAAAGLERLGLASGVTEYLSLEQMLPAPGQGALGVQCRDEAVSRTLLARIDDANTRIAVTAERAFLAGLGGGCALPIAAFARVDGRDVVVRGRVTAPDGSEQVEVSLHGEASVESARDAGQELARQALTRGVTRLLESVQ